MSMDYNYTAERDRENVYHVLIMCPEAQKIEKEHRRYGEPPASENRSPCTVCLREITAWLESIQ